MNPEQFNITSETDGVEVWCMRCDSHAMPLPFKARTLDWILSYCERHVCAK